jgi:hypothetical protein
LGRYFIVIFPQCIFSLVLRGNLYYLLAFPVHACQSCGGLDSIRCMHVQPGYTHQCLSQVPPGYQ